ncbi:cyclic nucleotide-binding domain-containing protein [Bdellovibrio svalbardensis]|uniref:Cyclic nucleotide-binding domain-containing protein n=1 Tax=Bdellovibrio svalbardensis TaxID=2972972 RepID=A0ABT6DFV1_9BACT|nr:cyclic nucleotide-binding domain-containing protein [Bdellovibrio svalbardensis]MDG0815379.1 cyclic nucleotide-binding domain-containing protein [Bdellovibrio svalbardensis]
MRLHPAEIAKEIKGYSFFKSFSEDLLLQVSAMVHTVTFKAGDFALTEGQKNDSLFFLRKGKFEVSLAGEVLVTQDTPGEVFGEMSVITSNPASTTIKALTDLECFAIRSDDFAHVHPKDKDRFQALLYQIYCFILTERLMKTNEKARLFEILNRELHEAQSALTKGHGGRVLLIEPDKKQQMPVRMALGGTGVHLDLAGDVESARAYLKDNQYDIVLSEEGCVEVLKDVVEGKLASHAVLLTSKDVQGNLRILEGNRFVEHIISRDAEDKNATIRYVLTALGKLLNKDLFGVEKYLTWGVEVQKKNVSSSTQREQLRDEMFAYFKKMGVRSTVLDRVNTVTEEMLMNAIYDAPTDAQGKPLFNHMTRKEEIQLDSHQQSQLCYGSDGVLLAVSVVDPFGSLTKEVIVDYLLTCYNGAAGSLNSQKGGAGRGLHQIIENSDLTIFNVKKGVRCEVICLFNIDGQKREAQPSFHYFFM